MKLYKMVVTTFIENEYEITDTYFYLTESEMQQAQCSIEAENKRDGKWIPNITSMDFYLGEVSFEYAKDEMTITQFENLFNTYVVDPRI